MMASIGKETNGRWRLQYRENGKPHSIRLGKMPQRQAETLLRRTEDLLLARSAGVSLSPELIQWANGLSQSLHAKFARGGLLPTRASSTVRGLGEAYMKVVCAKRPPRTAKTIALMQGVADRLAEYFGCDHPLAEVTTRDAYDFRQWLLREAPNKQARNKGVKGLAPASVSVATRRAREFFSYSVQQGWLAKNPFREETRGDETNELRDFEVTPAIAAAVLNELPNAESRAVFSLSRWGGLRCISELRTLLWSDVIWSKNRFLVRHPKHGQDRMVPLYPEVHAALTSLWDEAKEGVDSIFRDKLLRNVHWIIKRAITRAGYTPWPKLFQNMRVTRENELLADPRVTFTDVVKWQGHSPTVALTHYTRVQDSLYGVMAAQASESPDDADGPRVQCPCCGHWSAGKSATNPATRLHEHLESATNPATLRTSIEGGPARESP